MTWDDIERIETAYEERQEFTGKDDLVFSSVNGTAKLSGHKWANHWNALMDGIGVSRKEWKEERNLTWYSLSHFGITMRILAGVNVLDVSKLAGTSIGPIENTYLKYQEEQMKTQAIEEKSMRTFVIQRSNREFETDTRTTCPPEACSSSR